MRHGYGVLLVDAQGPAALETLAQRLNAERLRLQLGRQAQRAVAVSIDMDSPRNAELFRRLMRHRGYNIEKVLVVSSSVPDLRLFTARPLEAVQNDFKTGVHATMALCRLLAADMAEARRGSMLLVGVCTEAQKRGLHASCVAFLEALHSVLYRELMLNGVEVSYVATDGFQTVKQVLASSCMSSLAAEPQTRKQRLDGGPAPAAENATTTDKGQNGKRRQKEEEEDDDDDWTWVPTARTYKQLALRKGFRILPMGATIDWMMKTNLANVMNTSLVFLAIGVYAMQTLDLSPRIFALLSLLDSMSTRFFIMYFFARWWSRGLKPDYLLTPAMVLDLFSLVPSFLPPERLGGVRLTFFKIARVFRFYRLFQPEGFKDIVRIFVSKDKADQVDQFVKPFHLQIAQAVWVLFTLLYCVAGVVYEAEHRVNPEFGNFFTALYFSLVTLSTAGFGDVAPQTSVGRLAVVFGIIAGLCIVPYMATAVTSAVAEENQRAAEEEEAARRVQEEAVMTKVAEGRRQLTEATAMITELETFDGYKQSTRERLKKIFDTLDVDGDGALDVHEVAKLFSDAPSAEQADQVAATMFKLADADGSGCLTFDEFIEFADLHDDGE